MAEIKEEKINLASDAAPSKSQPKDKEKKKDKKPFFLIRWWKAIVRWFKELKSEAKKVTWPGFKQVCKSTAVVALVTVIVGAIVILSDIVFRQGLNLIIDLF